MMEDLHMNGELEVKVEKEGKEMLILFTYKRDEDEEVVIDKVNDEKIISMLDDELDEYINKLTDSLKKL